MRLPDDCLICGNYGARQPTDDPTEIYCDCPWGRALKSKDDEGSLYTLRAFILRQPEKTP